MDIQCQTTRSINIDKPIDLKIADIISNEKSN